MEDPNRKGSEPKITLSPPALFALAAVIFFLAGGIFAYVQLLSRGFQRSSVSPTPAVQQGQITPTTPSPAGSPSLAPVVTPSVQSAVAMAPSQTPTPSAVPQPAISPEATPETEATPTREQTPEETPVESPSSNPVSETPNPGPNVSVKPSPAGQESSGASSDVQAVKNDPAEQAEVRKEVLARIDLLKELSEKERDYLYAQVQRARGFTKLAIIPFPLGKTRPEQFQVDHLLTYLQKPEYRKLFEDPTVVFVVAGYADAKGNQSQNLEISKERAENVAKILENEAKIVNTIRAVGMGGSEFFGHGTPDKNRVVEIWLAAP
jgi:outer membrane protein OmpA-like peptidoglycan-associated protein